MSPFTLDEEAALESLSRILGVTEQVLSAVVVEPICPECSEDIADCRGWYLDGSGWWCHR